MDSNSPETKKKVWETPTLEFISVEKTEGGTFLSNVENASYYPES